MWFFVAFQCYPRFLAALSPCVVHGPAGVLPSSLLFLRNEIIVANLALVLAHHRAEFYKGKLEGEERESPKLDGMKVAAMLVLRSFSGFSGSMHVYCCFMFIRILPLQLLINAAIESQHVWL